MKPAMPICLKHNTAHRKKYPYPSCYYHDDLVCYKASRGEQGDGSNRLNGADSKEPPVGNEAHCARKNSPRNPESLTLDKPDFLDCGIARVMSDVIKEKKKVRR